MWPVVQFYMLRLSNASLRASDGASRQELLTASHVICLPSSPREAPWSGERTLTPVWRVIRDINEAGVSETRTRSCADFGFLPNGAVACLQVFNKVGQPVLSVALVRTVFHRCVAQGMARRVQETRPDEDAQRGTSGRMHLGESGGFALERGSEP